jgi:hypothetical protein
MEDIEEEERKAKRGKQKLMREKSISIMEEIMETVVFKTKRYHPHKLGRKSARISSLRWKIKHRRALSSKKSTPFPTLHLSIRKIPPLALTLSSKNS